MNNFVSKTKNLLKVFLGLPLTILSIYFIGSILFNSRTQLFPYLFQIRIFPLILGFVFLILFFLLRSEIWLQIINKFGIKLNRIDAYENISLSELKRYIPGNIFAFVDRVKKFKKLDISRGTVLRGILLESLVFVLTSAVVSVPGCIYILQVSSKSVVIGYLPVINFLQILIPVFLVISAIISFIFLRNRLKIKSALGFILGYFDVMFAGVLAWVCFGIGSALIAISVADFNPYAILPLSSLFVLSWLLGYISFISPMGLGVREGVIIYALSHLVPMPVAAAIAVLLRASTILSELLFLSLVFFVKKLNGKFNFLKQISSQFYILIFSITGYIVYFTYVTFEKHNNFFTGRFDLGNMDQTVWNTLHGRFFMLTNPDSTNLISRLSIHADFILVLLAPFYLLWQNPKMLLFIQSAVLGLGALFVYLISVKILEKKNLSLIFSISYLLNTFVEKQNMYDFHAITLSTTFLLASYYFLIRKKYLFFILFIVLSVLTKENVFLIAALFGLTLLFQKKKILGFTIFAFSITSFYLLVSKFIPGARGSEHFALSYFQDFGDSPMQIIRSILSNPFKTLSYVFSLHSLSYLHKLLFPVGYLPIFFPAVLIFALPDFLINILSKNENFTSMTFHYAATIIPFVYIGSIYGAKKILSSKIKIVNEKILFYYILLISLLSAWSFGPLPGSNHPSIEVFANKVSERSQILEFMSKIPQNFSVAATNNLGAHLSHRERIYTIPSGINEADIILFLLNDPFAQPSLAEQTIMVNDLKNNTNYILVYSTGDFIAFERRDQKNEQLQLSL